MSKQPIDENTLFLLTDVQAKFADHFGVDAKGHSTLCRYAKGLVIPHTGEIVRLGVVYTVGRARKTSLRLWNKFFDDLNNAYVRALAKEEAGNG